jgi:hypothetical protein
MTMKLMKYSGTHLHMCIKMNSQINVFVSANQQNLPNIFCMKIIEIKFKLGMNIIFEDGTGKSKHVVYKGATASGLRHVIRHIDGP